MAKKKTRAKQKKQQTTYFDHLEILRRNIISILAFLIIAFTVCFLNIEKIMLFLQEPVAALKIKLYYFSPHEKFITYIKIAFFSAIFITVPFSLVIGGAFIFPALKKGERTLFFTMILITPVLFLGGCFFAYKVITPAAFNFFMNFAVDDNVAAVWGIGSYFNLLIGITFASGFIFIIPVALLALIKSGVFRVRTLELMRPYLLIAVLFLAAVFTPPDIITQLFIGIPLYLLLEITILTGKLIDK